MSARSLLFVPGDSDRKLAKIAGCGADIVILDLEDSVAAAQQVAARGRVSQYLAAHPQRPLSELWVRINALGTAAALADLAAVVGARPDGIVQPKTASPEEVIRLGHYLDAFEQQHGLTPGGIRILPIATETPAALFALGGFARCGARLHGLTWGAEDLSAAIGASGNKDARGEWTAPMQLARSLCLFAAHAAGVAAVDTLHVDYRDAAGLRSSCARARSDGFTGKLAIHPDQVAVINECFAPSAEEVAQARRVVALFAQHPGVAALALDGRMVDRPHLRQAENTLERLSRAQRPTR